MKADHFIDLLANGHDRIQGRHWLLKDHGDFATAHLAQAFW